MGPWRASRVSIVNCANLQLKTPVDLRRTETCGVEAVTYSFVARQPGRASIPNYRGCVLGRGAHRRGDRAAQDSHQRRDEDRGGG